MAKAVFIVYNQANTEKVFYMLNELGIRGYTFWEQVQGRGSQNGEPRHGERDKNAEVQKNFIFMRMNDTLDEDRRIDAEQNNNRLN